MVVHLHVFLSVIFHVSIRIDLIFAIHVSRCCDLNMLTCQARAMQRKVRQAQSQISINTYVFSFLGRPVVAYSARRKLRVDAAYLSDFLLLFLLFLVVLLLIKSPGAGAVPQAAWHV